ncbi:3-hydroxyacyl-CoA dehydrogenase NAD-binding domain-containing protein [Cereibacter johrii]|uniref:3-hydroxyacyl-CoA dehydrogenase NAD-binding domain-containing protein n=1 Tax=Cereibacter johrii TaxID=445629 RepID=UPI002B25B4FC|nr:3-hydroxyacyl-CoA dehydrogenase NAD-binding domain-containing protein [Cereibacter johrii]MEA5160669.1 3-hydroxyacyl-CoA dehydrogenase NAD-binding domain-containing protein [Cereibacter johrii]
MTNDLIRRSDSDGIALLTLANPPVNALGLAVRQRLAALTADLEADESVRAVVLAAEGRVFVGGADIAEFDRPPEAPHLPDMIAAIEASRKPWIAALNGAALGGGAELALGCHYRIFADTARLGLPETSLGLIPGAGGTQRLPRRIGLEPAIEVIAAGRTLSATEAREAGLADRIAVGDPIAEALAFARTLEGALPPPASAAPLADPGPAFWDEARARTAKAARGNPAPAAALEAIRVGVAEGFAAGLRAERETFLRLRASDEAAALRHLFFAERAALRPAALRGIEPVPLARAGVIGGGTMGSGIAAALAAAGLKVRLAETGPEALAAGLARIEAIFEAQVQRGLTDRAGAAERMARVAGTVGLGALADCDLVIEAVFEDLAVKRRVFEELVRLCGPEAILATNTSYLDPERIVEGLPHPHRFIALHFFSPAQVMKLLEIVPLTATAPRTLATGVALAARLGKIPVQAGNGEGFIGNRILKRYRAEAEALLLAGATPAEIDQAMRAFGLGMGPFEMQDMAGLDIAFRAREAARALGQDLPEGPGDRLVRAGRLGRKSGGGWYDYAPGSRLPQPSPDAAALIAPFVTPGPRPSGNGIAHRLIAAMAEEGQRICDEGLAQSPSDIDLVEVHGYGFPRHKGGPMFHAARKAQARKGGE